MGSDLVQWRALWAEKKFIYRQRHEQHRSNDDRNVREELDLFVHNSPLRVDSQFFIRTFGQLPAESIPRDPRKRTT